MSTVKVTDKKGATTGQVTLGGLVPAEAKGEQAVHEAVVAYHANQRQGNSSSLTRGEVSGGGRKPYRQKGTGRARQGSTRANQYRHGGIAFGPKPRDYRKNLPKQVRRLAFQRAFATQWNAGNISVVADFELRQAKTKLAIDLINQLGLNARPLLIIVDEAGVNFLLSTRNIAGVETSEARNVNVYQILKARQILITRAGLDALAVRLGTEVSEVESGVGGSASEAGQEEGE